MNGKINKKQPRIRLFTPTPQGSHTINRRSSTYGRLKRNKMNGKIKKTAASASGPTAGPPKPQKGKFLPLLKSALCPASLRRAFRRKLHARATTVLLLSASQEELLNALSTTRRLIQEGYLPEVRCIGRFQAPCSIGTDCRLCPARRECPEECMKRKALVHEILSLCLSSLPES